jgi:hypothetical protein
MVSVPRLVLIRTKALLIANVLHSSYVKYFLHWAGFLAFILENRIAELNKERMTGWSWRRIDCRTQPLII